MTSAGMSAIHVLAALLMLGAAHWAAPQLPNWVGWENGPFESFQALLLLAGGLLAGWYGAKENNRQTRWFWWVQAPIWVILAAREMSWGVVFLPPLSVLPSGEPVFSARRQLWYYKPLLRPLLVVVALACAVMGIRSRQHEVLRRLWRQGDFPLLQIVIVAGCMLLSAAAEGKLGLSFAQMQADAAQIFEELAEGTAYVFMLLGQHRARRGLRAPHEANSF